MICAKPVRWPLLLILAVCTGYGGSAAAADATETRARQIWQLLDYVAVDYGGAVASGNVLQASEYAEMQEFSATAERELRELPDRKGTESLLRQISELRDAVANKADPATVARIARALSGALRTVYPFPMSPSIAPDVTHGAQLFEANCAACHGLLGHGDGPAAAALNPKPTVLTDRTRARERSLFAVYQIVGSGVQGTAMQGFGSLSDMDRWALAFFVGTLPYSPSDQNQGAKLWQLDKRTRDWQIKWIAIRPPHCSRICAVSRAHWRQASPKALPWQSPGSPGV
jgi:high-affinity iron transporter